jgi:hypothetical protein
MTPQTKFRHGGIVWAYLRSSRTGKREKHPAVILSDNADIVQPEQFDPRKGGDNTVYVIGVSTKYKSHALPYVQLPYESRGHPVTRLTHDCAVVIGWYHRVSIPDDVLAFGGDVPPDRMRQINDAVRQDLARKVQAQLQTVADMLGDLLPEDEE